jgi:hypothetical protein
VIQARLHRWTFARGVFMTLAALALALKVLIPAGFMTAPERNGLPFAVVLCTGQGAKVVDAGALMDHGKTSGKPSHDQTCPFAGHGAPATAPDGAVVQTVTFAAYVEPAASPAPGLAPGRGLAAPPLPARGPPSRLI